MKLERVGRNGGGRNGGRAGPRVLISLFLFDFLVPDFGYLRYGLLGRGKTYKTLGKNSSRAKYRSCCCLKSKVAHKCEIPEFRPPHPKKKPIKKTLDFQFL